MSSGSSIAKIFWLFAHILFLAIQLVLLALQRTSSNAPLSDLPDDLLSDSSVLGTSIKSNRGVSLEPVFIVWIPLYLVLVLSFSDLNFYEQEISPPTFECKLFPPNFIKKVEMKPKEEKSRQLRKISRDSMQTACSDESFIESYSPYKDSPCISPQITFLIVNLLTNQ